jgi:hypothetical protein
MPIVATSGTCLKTCLRSCAAIQPGASRPVLMMPVSQLVTVGVMHAITGRDQETLRRQVERGEWPWIFSFSTTGDWSAHSWRIWAGSLQPKEVLQDLSTQDVVRIIVPAQLGAWVSAVQIAISFTLSRPTMSHLVRSGQLRAKRAGNPIPHAWLVSSDSLRGFLTARIIANRPKVKPASTHD